MDTLKLSTFFDIDKMLSAMNIPQPVTKIDLAKR